VLSWFEKFVVKGLSISKNNVCSPYRYRIVYLADVDSMAM
jgi:hypothetical protein